MPPLKRIARYSLFFGLAAVLCLVAVQLFLATRDSERTENKRKPGPPPFADPRLSYRGPYLNIDPEVQYVGSKACSRCHAEIAHTYARHPMSRSLLPVEKMPADTPRQGHHNPFKALGAVFSVEAHDGRVMHRQRYLSTTGKPLADIDIEVHYAIGSGNHGHSYLTNRDGFLFQTPISWYSQKEIWDLSPGDYREMRTGRPVPGTCLFCHADRSFPVEGSLNQFRAPVVEGTGIGCERCHGPGEKHVRSPGQFDPVSGLDPTIVNPARLPPRLRQAVCQQCHLEGVARVLPAGRGLYDFRPGLPLESCWSVFVFGHEEGKDDRAVNHVEQMYLSRCFLGSVGPEQMGCISCHDPHRTVPAGARTDFFRARCLRCHGREIAATQGQTHRVRECSLSPDQRRARNDSCIECHMLRYAAADIVHAASTDHRVLRRPATAKPPGAKNELLRLIDFRRTYDSGAPVSARDLAFAEMETAALAGKRAGPFGTILYSLEEHLWHTPEDWPAWEEKARVLTLLGRKNDALQDFKVVLAKFPERETALLGAARLAHELALADTAVAWWQKLLERDPWLVEPRARLTSFFLTQKSWQQALPHAKDWVRLDPVSIKARQAYARCLIELGHADEARRESAVVEGLRKDGTP